MEFADVTVERTLRHHVNQTLCFIGDKWRCTAVICSQSQRSACLLVAEAHKYALTHFLCSSEFSFVFLITEFALKKQVWGLPWWRSG